MKQSYTPLRHFIAVYSGGPSVWWDDSIRHHWMVEKSMQNMFENKLDYYMHYVLLL